MPESTQRNQLEALRYQANKEQVGVNRSDEEQIQSIADFIMATVPMMQSEVLKDAFTDMANEMVRQKGKLARAGSGEQEMPPEGGAFGGQPVPPPPAAGMPMEGVPMGAV